MEVLEYLFWNEMLSADHMTQLIDIKTQFAKSLDESVEALESQADLLRE